MTPPMLGVPASNFAGTGAQVLFCNVTVRIDEGLSGRTKVSVSARKLLIPKPDVANGILDKLSEKLK
jgi:hypothetical protein